jgi:hypothetical protein
VSGIGLVVSYTVTAVDVQSPVAGTLPGGAAAVVTSVLVGAKTAKSGPCLAAASCSDCLAVPGCSWCGDRGGECLEFNQTEWIAGRLVEQTQRGRGIRTAASQAGAMRHLFNKMEMPDGGRWATLQVSGRGLEHEVRAVDWQRRVIASQPQRTTDLQRQRVGQRDRGDKADELMEAIRAPTSDGQREVELRMGG